MVRTSGCYNRSRKVTNIIPLLLSWVNVKGGLHKLHFVKKSLSIGAKVE